MITMTVHKRDHEGQIMRQYTGELLARGEDYVCLRAVFAMDDIDTGYVVFRKGDVMTEWFFSERWYNIFMLQDGDDFHLKGWYCNITRPAELGEHDIIADDLALDVFVYPDGRWLLLDEDEFDALNLSPQEDAAARDAVQQLHQMVAGKYPPFEMIGA